MKWTQNNRHTDENRNVFVWDLKEGRKTIAQIWRYPEKFKPGGKILCFCDAFCFRKEKPENQILEDFKEEMKNYFEDYYKDRIV